MQPSGYGRTIPDRLGATFAALADPTRRAILARLATGEASVMELAAPFDMSQPAISKHLKVLERAGLVSRGRDAQRRPRRLEPRPLAEATGWHTATRRYAFAYVPSVTGGIDLIPDKTALDQKFPT